MEDKQNMALLNALARQRDMAMNAAAQFEAQLEVAQAENVELKAALAARQTEATPEAEKGADVAASPIAQSALP